MRGGGLDDLVTNIVDLKERTRMTSLILGSGPVGLFLAYYILKNTIDVGVVLADFRLGYRKGLAKRGQVVIIQNQILSARIPRINREGGIEHNYLIDDDLLQQLINLGCHHYEGPAVLRNNHTPPFVNSDSSLNRAFPRGYENIPYTEDQTNCIIPPQGESGIDYYRMTDEMGNPRNPGGISIPINTLQLLLIQMLQELPQHDRFIQTEMQSESVAARRADEAAAAAESGGMSAEEVEKAAAAAGLAESKRIYNSYCTVLNDNLSPNMIFPSTGILQGLESDLQLGRTLTLGGEVNSGGGDLDKLTGLNYFKSLIQNFHSVRQLTPESSEILRMARMEFNRDSPGLSLGEREERLGVLTQLETSLETGISYGYICQVNIEPGSNHGNQKAEGTFDMSGLGCYSDLESPDSVRCSYFVDPNYILDDRSSQHSARLFPKREEAMEIASTKNTEKLYLGIVVPIDTLSESELQIAFFNALDRYGIGPDEVLSITGVQAWGWRDENIRGFDIKKYRVSTSRLPYIKPPVWSRLDPREADPEMSIIQWQYCPGEPGEPCTGARAEADNWNDINNNVSNILELRYNEDNIEDRQNITVLVDRDHNLGGGFHGNIHMEYDILNMKYKIAEGEWTGGRLRRNVKVRNRMVDDPMGLGDLPRSVVTVPEPVLAQIRRGLINSRIPPSQERYNFSTVYPVGDELYPHHFFTGSGVGRGWVTAACAFHISHGMHLREQGGAPGDPQVVLNHGTYYGILRDQMEGVFTMADQNTDTVSGQNNPDTIDITRDTGLNIPVGRNILNSDMAGGKIGWVYKEQAEDGEYYPIQAFPTPDSGGGGTAHQSDRRAGGRAHQIEGLSEDQQLQLALARSVGEQ